METQGSLGPRLGSDDDWTLFTTYLCKISCLCGVVRGPHGQVKCSDKRYGGRGQRKEPDSCSTLDIRLSFDSSNQDSTLMSTTTPTYSIPLFLTTDSSEGLSRHPVTRIHENYLIAVGRCDVCVPPTSQPPLSSPRPYFPPQYPLLHGAQVGTP